MSARDASDSTDPPTKPARRQMFEVRDDKPEPEPPQFLRRKIDPFEDPPEVRRRPSRASSVITARPTRPLDLISAEPELMEPPIKAPLFDTAGDLQRAQLLRSRSYDMRPSGHLPAPGRSVFDLIRDQPWLLAVVCAACIAIIVLASPAPQLVISSGGRSLATSLLRPAGAQPAPLALDTPFGEHSVVGEPTIDAQVVDAVLAKYGSPAAGTGRAWVQLGQQYGIDPVYALAFFIHESTAGTNPGWAGLKPDGTTTHNVGNIICAGYATCYKGHRDYPSWEAGIQDWYRLIAREYIEGRGVSTLEQILPIYCPMGDGCSPDNYVQVVNNLIHQWKQGNLSP
jgi:hypothetical protein